MHIDLLCFLLDLPYSLLLFLGPSQILAEAYCRHAAHMSVCLQLLPLYTTLCVLGIQIKHDSTLISHVTL